MHTVAIACIDAMPQIKHTLTPAGRMGLLVCYDLRFPWLSDQLRFDHGCDILTYPSAFTVRTGKGMPQCIFNVTACC